MGVKGEGKAYGDVDEVERLMVGNDWNGSL